MKLKTIKIAVFAIWTVLWLNFLARDLFTKGGLSEYISLVSTDAEGKRAIVYGKKFYALLKLAKTRMAPLSSYGFRGIDDLSLDARRGIYYLYPYMKTENPDYVIACDVSGFGKEGFRRIAELDEGWFILKRE
ncbi:MAG: hypothetical protein JW994_06030 [Candidatus Omnitrophica bacterium]|nr:hypothetical protein [Candidatus Omnitrophota bacterium]